MGSMTLLNRTGDVTLTWEDENNEKMLQVIQKKMDEGVSFFIVDYHKGREWLAKVKSTDEIAGNQIRIMDQDLEEMFKAGVVGVANASALKIDTVKRAETAQEVASNSSVAVQPIRGG